MRGRLRNLLFICIGLVLLSSCGGFEKIKKSSDVNMKLAKANEYYEKKQYQKANELYKDLMSVMKSTRNYEPLYYHYAYTFYYQKDYLDASYYFKNFTEYFPRSADAEECEFMAAVSLYKYAPKYTLDQTNTIKALEAMESYSNRYPKSKRIGEATDYLNMSRNKLEMKDADAAKLYYNIGYYKSAAIAFKSLQRNYPESARSDYYQYMILKSTYKYARGSYPEKQAERYASAMTAYNELKETFPHSAYLDDANKYYAQADNNIKKLRNEQPK